MESKIKKERKMKKKLFLISLLLLMTLSAFAVQRFVVGEIFTQTW